MSSPGHCTSRNRQQEEEDDSHLHEALLDLQAQIAPNQPLDQQKQNHAAVEDGNGQQVENAQLQADERNAEKVGEAPRDKLRRKAARCQWGRRASAPTSAGSESCPERRRSRQFATLSSREAPAPVPQGKWRTTIPAKPKPHAPTLFAHLIRRGWAELHLNSLPARANVKGYAGLPLLACSAEGRLETENKLCHRIPTIASPFRCPPCWRGARLPPPSSMRGDQGAHPHTPTRSGPWRGVMGLYDLAVALDFQGSGFHRGHGILRSTSSHLGFFLVAQAGRQVPGQEIGLGGGRPGVHIADARGLLEGRAVENGTIKKGEQDARPAGRSSPAPSPR